MRWWIKVERPVTRPPLTDPGSSKLFTSAKLHIDKRENIYIKFRILLPNGCFFCLMLPYLICPTVRFAWVFQPFLYGPCFLYKLHSPVVPFHMWSALPPQSTMKRSDSFSPLRRSSFSCKVLPACSGDIRVSQVLDVSFSTCHALWPRQALQDLALHSYVRMRSAMMRYRSPSIGFRFHNFVATCICSNEAELLQEGASFLTAHRIPCVRFVWIVRLCVSPSHSRKTRYGWLAKPSSMRTYISPKSVKLHLCTRNFLFSDFVHITK